ncbi:hypothetical protein BDV06DRAFT_222890 [Aspergillus oleicola]
MIYPDPNVEMSQAAVAPFSASLPSNTKDKDPRDYQVQYIPRGGGSDVTQPYVSTVPGVENLWTPSQALLSGYNSIDKQLAADLNGGPWTSESTSDSLMGCEHLYPSQLLPTDFLNDNSGIPFSTPTTIQNPCPTSSTSLEDTGASLTSYPFPLQPPSSGWSPNPISTPRPNPNFLPSNSHRPHYLTHLPPGAAAAAAAAARGAVNRRRSAPKLNIEDPNEAERILKHANRRASHNVVEKRYRVNLNRKFYELEQVVNHGTEPVPPTQQSLSSSSRSSRSPTSMPSTTKNSDGNGNAIGNVKGVVSLTARSQEGGTGSGPGEPQEPKHHSPKATIIESALSYIATLESENCVLKGRLRAFDAPIATDPSLPSVRRLRGARKCQERGLYQDKDHDEDLGDAPEELVIKEEN